MFRNGAASAMRSISSSSDSASPFAKPRRRKAPGSSVSFEDGRFENRPIAAPSCPGSAGASTNRLVPIKRKFVDGPPPRAMTSIWDYLVLSVFQRLGGEGGALAECLHLGPGDFGMGTPAEAAIGAGHDVFLADQTGETLDALRHQFGMLDHVSRMGDDAGNHDLAGGKLHRFPHRVFVLVPRVRRLEQIRLRLHLEHDVDEMLHLEVMDMRPVP